MSLRELTARLAFQVDRKILHAEEEDHYRADFSAHEKLKLPHKPKARAIALPKLPISAIKRFALTAATIFMALFFLTNMSAYSQIFMANVQDYMESTTPPANTTEEPTETAPLIIPDDGILHLDITPTTYENQLRIPSINVDTRIVEPELGVESLLAEDWNQLEDQIRSSLLNGVVHYPGTAEPDQKGNFFLTGHSSNVFWEMSPYNTVFALLPRIQIDDDIYVTYDQTEYHYRVTDKKEVSPKDVSILAQGDNYIMTLMTCVPIGTTLKRLVIIAELIED